MHPYGRSRSLHLPGMLAVAALLLAGCGKGGGAPQGAGAPPPMEVGTVKMTPTRESIVNELPGRIESTRVAEVRARVPGVVLQRVFREGTDVKQGQVLFRIDPAPLQADYNSVKANLERDEANLYQVKTTAERYETLVKANAVSKQEYDSAVAAYKQGQAAVTATRAALDRARLNLGYATVTAPISGRIGRALVTEGALVGQGEVTPLALIQKLDPIYVNFTQSVSEVSRLRAAFESGKIKRVAGDEAQVSLVLDDGSIYPMQGKLLFSDISVDPSTAQVLLRAEFPNPKTILLPGMYVRVKIEQGVDEAALTVPQQAVQRGANGDGSVLVVGADNKVESRPIKTGASLGNRWVVTDGLKAGDVVVVEGFQKLRPGAQVKPVAWQQPSADAAGANAAAAAAPAGSAPAAK